MAARPAHARGRLELSDPGRPVALSGGIGKRVAAPEIPPEEVRGQADEAEFERLLAEVENLSEDEAQAALVGQDQSEIRGDNPRPLV